MDYNHSCVFVYCNVDTDYLLGFHSNIPDLDPEVAVFRAKEKTQKKANKLYNNYCELNFPGSCVSNQYLRRDTIEIYNEPNFILLPVWFMTIMFNGDPYTFLVNGQTGLSVGNVPTDDRKVRLIRNLIAIPVTLIVFAIMFGFARLIMESRDFGQMVGMIFAQLFVSVFFLFFDFIIYSEIKKKYNSFDVDSRDRMLSVFANKRQKGD